jgi:hypothetical protein
MVCRRTDNNERHHLHCTLSELFMGGRIFHLITVKAQTSLTSLSLNLALLQTRQFRRFTVKKDHLFSLVRNILRWYKLSPLHGIH